MELNKEIQAATDKFIEEKLPAMVEEKVSKMVDGILDDVFRSYSDTAKQIKLKIEEKLDINLQKFDIVDYNALISKAINEKLVGLVNEGSVVPIMELVKSVVGFIEKKEINLSEIHQLFIDASMEYDETEFEGEITFIVEHNSEHKWHDIYIDTEGGKDKNDCDISFTIHENGLFYSFRANHWRSRMDKITPAKVTQLNALEHKIYRLYSAQVKVTIDETDFENRWDRHN